MPSNSKIYPLTMLRCAVLLHGEKMSPAWWSSTAASTGAVDIQYAFPRTAMTAAFTRAGELAKALHDERTRQQGFHHLFRLPHAVEADIHRETLWLEQEGELTTEKIEAFFDSFLKDASPDNQLAEGAVDCGKISILKQSDLQRIGVLYQEAFRAGKTCLPYFKLIA